MTRREAEDQIRMFDTLAAAGISRQDAEALRRISMTLHRWSEHECNGAIQRDGDDGDGRPFWYNTHTGRKIGPVPDRERGALARLASIMRVYPTLTPYVQGDPRGCSLYILRPTDLLPGHDIGSYYTRGIAVY